MSVTDLYLYIRPMQPDNANLKDVLKYADALAKDLCSLTNELAIWKYRVHSTMFIASATILTLVCSLVRPVSDNPEYISACYSCRLYWTNIATVLLNGICLLALGLVLYRNIYATDQVRRNIEKRFDTLSQELKLPSDAVFVDGEYKIISVSGRLSFFAVCEWVAYISFGFMVIGLMLRYYFM